MAKELGFSDEEAELYGQAARLHDVGKVGIPDNILLKNGRLTDDEFEIITTHTVRGVSILAGNEHFKNASEVCHYHHEHWNGKGYPMGISGEDIPLIARIVSVIDVFDALISKRCYKEPWSKEDAIKEIEHDAGSQFDPHLVDVFLKLYREGHFDIIINSTN